MSADADPSLSRLGGVMNGEIIAIGDELLSGRVINTTSTFAANRLFAAGYPVHRITAVGDAPEDISECLLAALQRSQFVLITGGLGPTSDDITNEVVSNALERPLVLYRGILEKIKQVGLHAGSVSKIMGEKLAWLPEGAEVLDPEGYAAGYLLMRDSIPIFCLPGVPGELEDFVERKVIPRLNETMSENFTVLQRTYRVFGLWETEINTMLSDLEDTTDRVNIGYYPNYPEVNVTVTAKDRDPDQVREDFDRACAYVSSKLETFIVAVDESSLAETVGKLLTERDSMLSIAESCTGGLLGHLITTVPGSSAWFERGVVTYSNQAKEDILKVSAETLYRYGAVSSQTAHEMADGIRDLTQATYGMAITGIAGPTGGTPQKPVGTVYIGLATPERTVTERFLFPGSRQMVQMAAAEAALDWLRRHLNYGSYVSGYRSADKAS